MENLTPRQIVDRLDKFIVGQGAAKKAVAIALRNRWRRLQLPQAMRDEIAPKNIIMIGPTGVGKTEIARRLAKLTRSPFIKVEASKFTEVGYVGRDVESMVRDLVEISIGMVQAEKREEVVDKARAAAEEKIIDLLLPKGPGYTEAADSTTREKFMGMLKDGKLEERTVEVEVEESGPQVEVLSNLGMEDMGMNIQDMMKGLFPSKKKKRKMKISEARPIIEAQETARLIDMDDVKSIAMGRVEQSGIIFLDEIDKVAVGREAGKGGADVSREGVQRDLLPIVEGSTVMTKYGMVRTDHILFIAAGAFHTAKPSDLIPELQGRFPIRVELESLNRADFVRILSEPENALTKQYTDLLSADGVAVTYTDDGIEHIAQIATEVNASLENIGARRLHTIMERILEDISFGAPDSVSGEVVIDASYVDSHLDDIVRDQDLSKYIL